jgi:hypothetical protein
VTDILHRIGPPFRKEEETMKLAAKLVLVCALATIVLAAPSRAAGGGNAGWERMKSLVGDWEGNYSGSMGKAPVAISYRLVSNGTTLMETMKMSMHGETDMITMYAQDGDRVVATHYCSEGNQPRMRAAVPAGEVGKLDFRFVDATNLPGPDAMHMDRLVVTFRGANHFTQEWTSRDKGKDDTGVFEYARKK